METFMKNEVGLRSVLVVLVSGAEGWVRIRLGLVKARLIDSTSGKPKHSVPIRDPNFVLTFGSNKKLSEKETFFKNNTVRRLGI